MVTGAGAFIGPVGSGIRLAQARCERYGIPFDVEAVQQTVGRADSVLREATGGEVLGEFAIEFFVENLAVAASVRGVNREPALGADDLRTITGSFLVLFNSLWHYDCDF